MSRKLPRAGKACDGCGQRPGFCTCKRKAHDYVEAKNLKHLKDAHGHLIHFDGSELSEWNRSLVDVARHNLGEAIQLITGKQ